MPDTWNGTCQTGPGFTATDCNNKLIGARFFVEGFNPLDLAPGSFLSPRDDEGHGSHTASTAAGNFGVDPTLDGNALGVNRISGIAPRARVAAYKACWTGAVAAGCASDDTTAAIDAAVEDGVDVINYSIGSDTSTVIGSDEVAFLGASDAGVFVANSAGNAGPDAETVGSPASVPWLTSVAAATNSRSFSATATITDAPGDDLALTGGSSMPALPATALIDAADAALAPATAEDAELCQADTLDPAKVVGKVVLCLRGVNDRIEKSKVVSEAGGVGMLLYNPEDPQDLSAYPYWIPTVALTHADGLLVKAAIADAGSEAKASISAGAAAATDTRRAGVLLLPRPADRRAGSGQARPHGPGRGHPRRRGRPDPGRKRYQARPPVPGHQRHLDGEPARRGRRRAAHAAAPDVLHGGAQVLADDERGPGRPAEDGAAQAGPFDAGSGQIDPNAAADPGLVLDATTNDYFEYLEAVGVPRDRRSVDPAGGPEPRLDLQLGRGRERIDQPHVHERRLDRDALDRGGAGAPTASP